MHDAAVLNTPTAEPGVEETAPVWGGTMLVRMQPAIRLNAEQLYEFCRLNRELRIEQTAEGELIIMAPSFWESGNKNAEITADLVTWARVRGGRVGDSSAGYTLPNTAMRAPDASWISEERFAQLTPDQLQSFAPVCPDFVLELRSRTDRLAILKRKMVEYIDNGARLGWLIDPIQKQVFVYRPGEPVEHLQAPATLSGDPVLAGFTLDLARVW